MADRVVVLVPGIMGSRLTLGDETVWPGPVSSLVFPFSEERMQKLLRDDLVASDVIRSVSFYGVYDPLIADLRTWGFDDRKARRTLVVAPYDWRKDNALAAKGLADRLDRVVVEHGAAVEIVLLAHSMGGLVSRFLLESGGFAGRPGVAAVRSLVTLATPHRGAPLALRAAAGLEKRLFLSAEQVRRVASDPRYPALYQLLPPPGDPFAWDVTPGKAYAVRDVYEAATAKALGLVRANLDSAATFREGLDLARRPLGVRYFCFVGTRLPTTTVALLASAAGGTLEPRKLAPEDAGDGTVPSWSATLPGVQGVPVGGEHSAIFDRDEVRSILGRLLAPERFAAVEAVEAAALAVAPGMIRVDALALGQPVVAVGGGVTVTLELTPESRAAGGEVRVERVRTGADGAPLEPRVYDPAPPDARVPVAAGGADRLALGLGAPSREGFYRVAFQPADETAPTAERELIVQALV